MNRFNCLLVLLGIYAATGINAQQIKINEAVSSTTIYIDEDDELSDWIELYNASGSDIDLGDWSITDDINETRKWVLPNFSLPHDRYLLMWASGKDRKEISFTQSIVKQGDNFKYQIPDASLAEDWIELDFNDDNWLQGRVGIGYGDGDDATTVQSGTPSIFLRHTFELKDVDHILRLILDIDYDDAFVAYINGKEVARANITGEPPFYNATATTDHEAVLYSFGRPDRFMIEDPLSVLNEGQNVLSIQVHNVSLSSSDLSIIPFLSAELDSPPLELSPVPLVIDLRSRKWHTNFKLSGGEETLYLFDPTESLVDSLELLDSPTDMSIGCAASGDAIQFFNSPTPGSKNITAGFDGVVVSDIEFSSEGGVVEAIELELSIDEVGGEIRYTTDATLPTENSTLYEGPISINENTVIRAQFFKDGYVSSNTHSRAYLVDAEHDLAIISLITEPDNFYDNRTGIYVSGNSAEADFPFFGSNFWEDWEKEVHFSFYDEDGSLGVETDAGIKIFGGWSRGFDQRSLSLFARKKYGDGSFKYPFFKDLSYTSFEALVLRNSGNDWNRSMLRDATLTSLMAGADIEYQAYRPTVVYLNGSYFGLYNLREKINEHFIASKQGLEPDSIDILERNASIIKGSSTEYEELIDFVGFQNMARDNALNFVRDRVDVDNFALYYAAQIYFDNTDWPGNNIKYWKNKNGKWRWVLFDTDFGFGIWNVNNFSNNTLDFALRDNGPNWPNPPWSTLLFRQLNQNTSFKRLFINQMADAMNSRFKADAVKAKIDEHKSAISSEVSRHFQRWNGRFSEWSGHIQNMKRFADQRSSYIKRYILEEYELPSVNELRLNYTSTSSGYLVVNDRLQINEVSWGGDYFATVPIRLTAIPKPGHSFSHWEGDISSTEMSIMVDVDRPMTVRAVFEQESSVLFPIVINEINYKSNEDFDTDDWIELYNTSDVTVDLTNWIVKDADTNEFMIPAGTLIEPEAYLVLARSVDQFQSLVPTVNALGDLGFGLSSNGDEVSLYNQLDELQDQVIYANVDPWPEDANGVGYTLELISPDLDNTEGQNWSSLNQTGSPGRENSMTTAVVEFSENEFMSVFPIPTLDDLFVELTLEKSSQAELSLVSIDGQVKKIIAAETLNEGLHKFRIDMRNLTNGLYLVHLKLDGKAFSLNCLKSN